MSGREEVQEEKEGLEHVDLHKNTTIDQQVATRLQVPEAHAHGGMGE